jgi:DNA-binding NarL/FixJ family response regulator
MALNTKSDGNRKIRVLLVEDHPVVRRGISMVLARHAGTEIAGEAWNGEDALRLVRELRPDVVLMDLDLPGLSGLEVAEEMHRKHSDARVILLTGHRNGALLRRAQAAGVCAFLPKESAVQEIVDAVSEVAAGRTIPFKVQDDGPDLECLTKKERDVLLEVASGRLSEEIAERLGMSASNVRVHRAALMRKLGARSAADLTRVAVSAGLVKT